MDAAEGEECNAYGRDNAPRREHCLVSCCDKLIRTEEDHKKKINNKIKKRTDKGRKQGAGLPRKNYKNRKRKNFVERESKKFVCLFI